MLKLITGGGLGDAAMALAKMQAKFDPKDIHLTHCAVKRKLLAPISCFYKTQKIKHLTKGIKSWDNHSKLIKNYDCWLETGWSDGWEINPFPALFYDKKDIDVLVTPAAGRNATRSFSKKELIDFHSDRITYVGKVEGYGDLPGKSLINQTTLKELVDLICSANVIIAPEGFVAYLGALAGKEVYVKDQNMPAIKKRKHPDWKMKIISSLQEVKL
jgi:hypothetical protein